MKKIFSWIGIVGAGLALLIIVVLLVIPFFIDIQRYKPEIEKRVSAAAGRPFAIGGDLQLRLFPWAGISFSDLRMGNPPGFREADFITVGSFDVQVKLIPLISKEVRVKRFVVKEPRIILVKNADGLVNWKMPPSEKIGKTAAAPAPESTRSTGGFPLKKLVVGEFAVTKGNFQWIDHDSDMTRELTDIELELDNVSLDQPIGLHFSAITDGHPFSLAGHIGPVGARPGEEDLAFDLTLKALEILVLQANGKIIDPVAQPAFDLNIRLEEFSPRKLIAAMGQNLPVDTSDPAVLHRLSLQAAIKGHPKKIQVRDGRIQLDDTVIALAVEAAEFDKPSVKFDVSVDAIDLDRYLPPKDKAKKTATGSQENEPSQTSTKKKTDYEPLRRLILDGTLKIGELKAGKVKSSDILVKTTAHGGVIRIDPFSMSLYQGAVKSVMALDVRQEAPRLNLNLHAAAVQAGPLLKDAAQKEILEGTAYANAQIRTAGDTPVVIKKNLNGTGELKFEDGAIVGMDLAGMARNIQGAFRTNGKSTEQPKTDFSELLVPFSIENGLVHTPGTVLKSPFIRLQAKGDAHLVQETLDFRIEPKVVATMKGQGDTTDRSGIMVPILVTGSFSSPKFSPDLKGILKNKIDSKAVDEQIDKAMKDPALAPLKETTKGLLKNLFD